MNKLMTTDVKMTSLDIAEVTGKRHADVMRDVRREVEELGDEIGQRIFAQSSYINKQNKEQPCYEFGKQGAMQLALKYDAKTRYNVISYIEQLENDNKPMTQLELMQMQVNQLIEQDRKLSEQSERISTVEKTTNDIKEVFTLNTHNWKEEVKRIINAIAKNNGGSYQSTWNKTYSDLEIRARCNLSRRLDNMKDRAIVAGASKREIAKMNNLGVIEADQRLIEIYLTIVKEMAIKYGIESNME